MSKRIDQGYTFTYPDGQPDWRIADSVNEAQSNAAFAMQMMRSSRTFPDDWDRAYREGFRIVRATRTVVVENPDEWRAWQLQ